MFEWAMSLFRKKTPDKLSIARTEIARMAADGRKLLKDGDVPVGDTLRYLAAVEFLERLSQTITEADLNPNWDGSAIPASDMIGSG